MIEVIHNKRPKPQMPWSLILGIILFLIASFMITGCAERDKWPPLGYHSPITKSGIGGAGI
jgi:hypothetical protein